MNMPPSPEDLDFGLTDVAAAAADLADTSARKIEFGSIESDVEAGPQDRSNIDLLLDVRIPVSVEVGRTSMTLDSILDLVPGSVVALEKRVEEPVELRVNGKLVAQGEVVLVDEAYGIRITQIVDPSGKIASARRSRDEHDG